MTESHDKSHRPPRLVKSLKSAPARSTDDPPSIAWCLVVKDALLQWFGSHKAAAAALQMDQGQFTRDCDAGKLAPWRLDLLDLDVKVRLGRALRDAYVSQEQTALQRAFEDLQVAQYVYDQALKDEAGR